MNVPPLFTETIRDIRGIETTPRADSEHLQSAIQWLYRTQDVTDCAGSAAGYNLVLGWSGPYPETSGYIVPTLYDYAEATGATEARERARRMASWLVTLQLDSGGFPAGVDPGPDPEPSVFNTGQILLGLVRAYRETGDETYREAARRASEWLVSVQHEDGYWDRFDYRDEIHVYCSRVAWSLLEVYEITGVSEFRDAAVNHLSWVVSQQRSNGWFEYCGFSPGETPFLHTIAYTIRGLLEGGALLDDGTFIDAARTAAEKLRTIQRQRGPLTGAYDSNWSGASYYCLTGNAQMSVVWFRLSNLCGDEAYGDAATEALRFLKAKQRLTGPEQVRGAIRGSHPVWGPYMRLRYPNWATKFFADAVLAQTQK
ncbi:terpene cyclase/mutase family protein [Halorussus salilacus]|uniref:prenyltransferase/squalene oxidase repeat-containing protein n=1 Tax=Halorussus salilacus TaxID=2953750 RepID=UPI0020A1FEAF|nr:prenyltransferase/squalene oxidase repeat-containing protein [Halorussus salilacus]USZ67398.1 terpene cyclase/mutase family protein [Halorussus salilacus]